MKKILLFIFLVSVLSSCMKIPYISTSSIIDYSYYSDKGFFITESNSVNFQYKPICSIQVRVESGYEVTGSDKEVSRSLLGGEKTTYSEKMGNYKIATVNEALDLIYKESVEKGANGVINMKITPLTAYQGNQTIITGYYVTGMAIKR